MMPKTQHNTTMLLLYLNAMVGYFPHVLGVGCWVGGYETSVQMGGRIRPLSSTN
jgi:hypothetical protein